MRHLRAASYIFKDRFGTYYFRFSIPKSLRKQAPNLPSEFRRSLNTKSEVEAIPKARLLWLQIRGQLGILPMNIFESPKFNNDRNCTTVCTSFVGDAEPQRRLILAELRERRLGKVCRRIRRVFGLGSILFQSETARFGNSRFASH